jgi:hypothetical protein
MIPQRRASAQIRERRQALETELVQIDALVLSLAFLQDPQKVVQQLLGDAVALGVRRAAHETPLVRISKRRIKPQVDPRPETLIDYGRINAFRGA